MSGAESSVFFRFVSGMQTLSASCTGLHRFCMLMGLSATWSTCRQSKIWILPSNNANGISMYPSSSPMRFPMASFAVPSIIGTTYNNRHNISKNISTIFVRYSNIVQTFICLCPWNGLNTVFRASKILLVVCPSGFRVVTMAAGDGFFLTLTDFISSWVSGTSLDRPISAWKDFFRDLNSFAWVRPLPVILSSPLTFMTLKTDDRKVTVGFCGEPE